MTFTIFSTYIYHQHTNTFFSHHLQKLQTFLKTWQRHVTSLKTQYGDVPTTRNNFVDFLHHHLICIVVQVHYTSIQKDLILQNHPYLINCLQSSLRILKYGYPASNIVINSIPYSCALILCITPLYLQYLMTYGLPTIVL